MKTKVVQNLKKIRECENLPEWIVVMVILTFSMFTMFYADFQGTMNYAFQVTRMVFSGGFGAVKYLASHPYGMTICILLIIWMLPFCLFTSFFDKGFLYYESIAGAFWSKLFLVVITVFFIKGIIALSKLLPIKEKYRKWIPLFLLTSVFYFLPVVEIGQCDVIAVMFMTWGMVYYLKGDLKKFLFFFAFAIPMKYFALMIFIPLVLLHEKNPIKVILEGIGGGSLLGINLIIRKCVLGVALGEFTSNAIAGMSATSNSSSIVDGVEQNATIFIESNAIENFFGSMISNSSLFVICYILVCVLAYAIKYDIEKVLWTMYIPLLVYAGFFLFTDTNVYWIVLLAPFMTMVVFSNESQLRLSMLLETVTGWAILFIYIFQAAWVVGGQLTFEYLFLKGKTVGSNVETLFHSEYDISGLLPYAYSAYVACMVGLLLINIPGIIKAQNANEKEVAFDRWIIWLRAGLLLLWVLLLIFVLLLHG